MTVDEHGWKWMKVDESGWKWMTVDGSGWQWMKVDAHNELELLKKVNQHIPWIKWMNRKRCIKIINNVLGMFWEHVKNEWKTYQ